jgi:hypothetical protein
MTYSERLYFTDDQCAHIAAREEAQRMGMLERRVKVQYRAINERRRDKQPSPVWA